MTEQERNEWMEQNEKLYHYFVWHFVSKYHKTDPDEIASIVGYAFARALPVFDPERGTIQSLVYRIVGSELARQYERQGKRWQLESMLSLDMQIPEAEGATLGEVIVDETVRVEERVEDNAILNVCYSGLNEKERDIAYKRFILGMKYADIAEEYGVTRQAIHLRVNRIIKKCRETLTKHGYAPDTKEGE